MLLPKSDYGLFRTARISLITGTLAILLAGSAAAELIGHWTLDDGLSDPGALVAVDSSDKGHDGELINFLDDPVWVDGKYGGAINLSGEIGAIEIDMEGDIPIGNEPRTYAAWVNVEAAAQAFFMSYGAGGAGGQFSVSVELNGDTPDVRVRHGGGNMFFPTAVEGEWMHVAVVVPDGAEITDDIQVFIDGEETFNAGPTGVVLNTNESEFVIGGKWGLPENRAFEGIVDDVWFFNEALDQAAILEIMAGGAAASTLLEAGDANMDLQFDQLDLVQVQIAAKYLSGQAATWGDGDWDAAPGGEPGNPPQGDGMFNQLDIISALGAGKYLTGPYGALSGPGQIGDEQTSLVYNTATGELSVDSPASTDLTSINIDSAGSKFIGDKPAVLDGAFDNFAADNIFKATFGGSFGDISFGNVLPSGLNAADVTADLTAVGSLAGGGDLGDVDLVFVPEPFSAVMMALGMLALHGLMRPRRW